MIRRLFSLVLLCWVLGFIIFAITLPKPVGGSKSAAGGAVVVLTGGEGRIARGLQVLRQGWAAQMLVAGVDPEVQRNEFAKEYQVEPQLMQCCVTLGIESVDTRSNAQETLKWVRSRQVSAVRLVTSDWHMRRAYWELRRVLPANVRMTGDAVRTRPRLNTLVVEYCKLLARRVAALRG